MKKDEPKTEEKEVAKPMETEVEESDQSTAEDSQEGVNISEDFQVEVHNLVNGADKHECDYLRSCLNSREDELMKEKIKLTDTDTKPSKSPKAFSTSDMPYSD